MVLNNPSTAGNTRKPARTAVAGATANQVQSRRRGRDGIMGELPLCQGEDLSELGAGGHQVGPEAVVTVATEETVLHGGANVVPGPVGPIHVAWCYVAIRS